MKLKSKMRENSQEIFYCFTVKVFRFREKKNGLEENLNMSLLNLPVLFEKL